MNYTNDCKKRKSYLSGKRFLSKLAFFFLHTNIVSEPVLLANNPVQLTKPAKIYY